MTTPLLGLSEIAEGVANQVTIHNTALRQIEAMLVGVISKSTATPPATPAAGDAYIIPASPTGAWAGKTNQVAISIGGAWFYVTPREGLAFRVNDIDGAYVYDGSAWVADGGAGAAIASHVAEADPHTQYQKESEKGVANGYASLGSDGKLPVAQLPNLAVIDFLGTVANQAAMLALAGQKGDWCARSDTSTVYVITGADPTQISSWTALSYPTGTGGTVTSVGLTTPGLLFDVAGSPVTGAGTLAMSLKTQVKNTFLAGPTSGADAAPTMRGLVAADMAALLAAVNVFTKNQSVAAVSLGSGVSPAIDASLSNNFKITLGANNTLVNPTNLTEGMILNFAITQDATGSRTLSYGSLYKFPGGTAPVLSTAANAKDFMSCYYDGSVLLCQMNKGFA